MKREISYNSRLATASMVFGIIGVVSSASLLIFLPVFCGGMAVGLALLSRGGESMGERPLAGLILGMLSFVFMLLSMLLLMVLSLRYGKVDLSELWNELLEGYRWLP